MGSSKLVIIAGLAELFSGAISMGLGAYLAAVTERDEYLADEAKEWEEIATKPEKEKAEIYQIMRKYGIRNELIKPIVASFVEDPANWVKVNRLISSES